MMKSSLRFALLTAVTGALLAGCSNSSKQDSTSYEAISRDLTPDLRGFVERPIDIDSHIAYTNNTNWRAASDDLGRIFYTDHPSRLSSFPTVATSGNPR